MKIKYTQILFFNFSVLFTMTFEKNSLVWLKNSFILKFPIGYKINLGLKPSFYRREWP